MWHVMTVMYYTVKNSVNKRVHLLPVFTVFRATVLDNTLSELVNGVGSWWTLDINTSF
jgi:hypothetical protein